MAINFDEIMDTVAESVERPPLAPLGDYVFNIPQIPVRGAVDSEKGSWDTIEFQVVGVRPTDTVDPDLFKAYGDAKNIRTRLSFMFDKNDDAAAKGTEFRLKTFLVDHLGLDSKLTLKELLNASVNHQFIGSVNYRADRNDPNTQYHNITKTAPLA